MNYFRASPESPYHLSIGAIPIDSNGKVYCHYWEQKFDTKDIYALMRETIEPNETIEQALQRGLMEEFGMTGNINHFAGSIVAVDEWFGERNTPAIVEKTTLYFLVNVESFDLSNRLKDDRETDSEVIALGIDELINKMEDLEKRSHINYIGESKILKSVKGLVLQ